MIKTIGLQNFKAFRDTGDIEIKPITVLAGPNSSGKTSILQSLLLLKQTVETDIPDIELNLDGRFLQYLQFNELSFGKPYLRSSKIGYRIGLETRIPSEVVPRYFPDLTIPEDLELLPLKSDLDFSFKHKDIGNGDRRVISNNFNIKSTIFDVVGPQLKIQHRGEGYRVKMDGEGLTFNKRYKGRKILDVAKTGFLPRFLIFEPENQEDHHIHDIKPLNPIFFNPIRDLEEELNNKIKYLGPLRAEPQRAYLHSATPSPEIGQKGEFAAQLLWLDKDIEIEYLQKLGQQPQKMPLKEAVRDAFQSLGINQPLDVRSEKTIVYQLFFGIKGSGGKKQVTIADVGFGVSQLLPIVMLCLRSSSSSLLLFEQPEIHLHPKVQARLADFFLKIALSGKRLLIETHSDHFINRLRRRIAEDPTNELSEKVSILFVRPTSDSSGSKIEPLKVNQFGVIENWPPDFLPESADEAEAIFKAGLEKRKKQ